MSQSSNTFIHGKCKKQQKKKHFCILIQLYQRCEGECETRGGHALLYSLLGLNI